jgi:hypothetical protein
MVLKRVIVVCSITMLMVGALTCSEGQSSMPLSRPSAVQTGLVVQIGLLML